VAYSYGGSGIYLAIASADVYGPNFSDIVTYHTFIKKNNKCLEKL
jgi:hypothetical protein